MAGRRTAENDSLPAGFAYQPEFLNPAEELELLRQFEDLEFHPSAEQSDGLLRAVLHGGKRSLDGRSGRTYWVCQSAWPM